MLEAKKQKQHESQYDLSANENLNDREENKYKVPSDMKMNSRLDIN